MDNIHNDTHVYGNSVNINNVQSYLQLNITVWHLQLLCLHPPVRQK